MAFKELSVSSGRPIWGHNYIRASVIIDACRGARGNAAGKSFIHQRVIEVLQPSVTRVSQQKLSVWFVTRELRGCHPTLPRRVRDGFPGEVIFEPAFNGPVELFRQTGGGGIRVTQVERTAHAKA